MKNFVATACHRAEPSAVAFLCFSEDELDDWWNGLDVEAKADAFAGFSLRAQGQDDSFVHIDDSRVRVEGVIGDNRAACGISQADGAGDQAVQS